METTPPTCNVEPVSLDCDCKRWVLRSSGHKIENYMTTVGIRFIFQFCMHIMEFAAVVEVYGNIGRIKDLALL